MSAPGGEGAFPLSVVTRRVTQWENGAPVVRDVPMLTKSQIVDTIAAVVSLPYHDPDDDLRIEMGLPPSRFYGMTNAEAMVTRLVENAARTGDKDEIEKILDRLLGRPKTTAEVHSVSETYEQALNRIARETEVEAARVKAAAVVEAEIVGPEDGL
jgi:hypothetical protein